mgnify:CR=1 FL=1
MFDFFGKLKDKGRWRIFKLKLIDARLYFVSIFVGLLTGLVAVPYHYLLQFFFNLRHDFFDSHPKWYWYIPLFLLMWGILVFVSWLVKKMPLITGGGIPQTRGVINGRVDYKHPFLELVAKFVGGILALSTGLSLGREGPSVQIGSYVGYLVSKWGRVLSGERKQLLSAGAGAGLAAAFAAPLASSLLVIESIERFDAPKTAISTLLAGSLPKGAPKDTYYTWVESCKKAGAKVFLDADGELLAEGLKAAPYLVKPNNDELSRMMGRELKTLDELADAGQALIRRGIEHVVVSMGGRGALYLRKDSVIYAPALKVKVGSTVGAGDSVVAALAYAEAEGLSEENTVRLSIATGAANVMCSGTQAAERSQIEELLPLVTFQHL